MRKSPATATVAAAAAAAVRKCSTAMVSWVSILFLAGIPAALRAAPAAAWQDAAAARTVARVAYGDGAVYVAMRMYADPGSVVSQLARRDVRGVFSDWAHVMIDSYHDHRTAFRFSVTPAGTRKDVLHYDDRSEDLNWDAVWQVATRVDSLGWTAEFRIAFSQLRFNTPDQDADGMVWGINFGRDMARLGESVWWSPVIPSSGGFVSDAGDLFGLRDIQTPRRLELMPYAVGRLTRAPGQPGNPFYDATAPYSSVGLDLKYGITSNLTLSATINPDFGQVEADPSVVNLSAYETFFPEKRPFFLEGSNIFEFNTAFSSSSGEQLFYSRRIGRSPQRRLVSGDVAWADAPNATTILGAAKVSGRTAGGWTVGVLNAVTGQEDARIVTTVGDTVTEPVEPLTNYFVASLARDFRDGRSSVGAMFTATNRRLPDSGLPSAASAPAPIDGAAGPNDFVGLTSAAYAGGIRGRHRFAEGAWQATGWVAGSYVRGNEETIALLQRSPAHYFQRPDAAHVEFDPSRTSLAGMAADVRLGKIGGDDPWRGILGGHIRSPGFDINDLGFQNDGDLGLVFANLTHHWFEPTAWFRGGHTGINPAMVWTTAGERLSSQMNIFGGVQLHNFWRVNLFGSIRDGGVSTVALRGGPSIRRPDGYSWSVSVNGDPRDRVVLGLDFNGGGQLNVGSPSLSFSPDITIRPSARLNLSLSPRISWNHKAWQYVGQPADVAGDTHYVFAALAQTTVSFTTRLNLTLRPGLSLQLYAQPFVSAGDYSGFMEVSDPRAEKFEDRFRRYDDSELTFDAAAGVYTADPGGDAAEAVAFGDPDFNIKQMRGNAVLRWQYSPGSTIYLVWSQSRSAFVSGSRPGPSFDFGRDVGRLFNTDADFATPVTNVFLIKVDYWLSF